LTRTGDDLRHSGGVTPDPFMAAELRRRVLGAWAESPARFRADANVEDDLALVGYRDRVIVELAQNAADAAARASVPGRLILDLDGDVLTATNNGAPLDAAGVESISVARASAKLDQPGTVGRFGVGFAAVVAVSDEPLIISVTGAVRWSRAEALAAAHSVPELSSELAGRGDRVPVLRLPFAAPAGPVVGGDTAVVLPLRDAKAAAAVRAQLTGLDQTVLLVLPALAEIVVRLDGAERVLRGERTDDVVELSDGPTSSRWLVVEASGTLPPELLADRPAEDQRSDAWQVTWALPVDAAGNLVPLPASVPRVVRAPTAVDDRLTVPAVLIASYPLDASRRRVTTGALADAITAHAADALAAALADLPPDPALLRLVPTGFPDGAVDGGLHAALLERLRGTAWLPVASDADVRQRPADALVVADPLVASLSRVVRSLLPVGWSHPELTALGVRRPSVAELVDALDAVTEGPAWWRAVYAALDEAVPPGAERDALGALPVPLTDGTTVTGPRGLVLPSESTPPVDLSAIGIRMVHPDAAHELLRALGAGDGTPRGLLEQPQVRAAVEASYDEEDPEPIALAVLSLLAVAGVNADELPWLADLALPDDGGDWRSAGELLLPGGGLASMVEPDSDFALVAGEWVQRWGAETLLAAGVLDDPVLVRDLDATGPSHDLDGEPAWWAGLPPGAAVEDFVAVRDLEQVRADALPDLVALLSQPPLRSAVVAPAFVTPTEGGRLRMPSYTAWWLSSRPVLAGRVPRELRLAASDPALDPLYDIAPVGFDDEFLHALGVLDSLRDADPDDVLTRLTDAGRDIDRSQLRVVYGWLSGQEVTAPDRLRAVRDRQVTVVEAGDAVIVDAPDLFALLGDLAVVPVVRSRTAELAERLDLPLASELADFAVVSKGAVRDDAVVHDALRVADVDGVEREVAWRLVNTTLHVDGRRLAFGLGRGRAWRDGGWAQRHRWTEMLIDPAAATLRDDEDDLDDLDDLGDGELAAPAAQGVPDSV
jgi:hypothetical protein